MTTKGEKASASGTSAVEFIPQYFEIREVGKHIKS